MKTLAATAGIVVTGFVVATVIVVARQDPQHQVPPIFRTQVDVIQLDVSVLDKDRRPVRGLQQSEFTVLENGKPQRIVAITEIDAVERDPAQSAWMRHVGRDVTMNDLNDMVGDGHLYAIVLDDRNIPWDNLDIIQSTRSLRPSSPSPGPSGQAAVVYTQDAGRGEDSPTTAEARGGHRPTNRTRPIGSTTCHRGPWRQRHAAAVRCSIATMSAHSRRCRRSTP
jgi:hypothetical protein